MSISSTPFISEKTEGVLPALSFGSEEPRTNCRREPESSFPESRFDGRTKIVSLRALKRFNPKNGLPWETEFETLVSQRSKDLFEAIMCSRPNPQEPASDLMVQWQFLRATTDPFDRYEILRTAPHALATPKVPEEIYVSKQAQISRVRGIHQRQESVPFKTPEGDLLVPKT